MAWRKTASQLVLIFSVVGTLRCGSSGLGGGTSALSPSVAIESVSANPNNVLSAVVGVSVRDADKVRISYQPMGASTHSSPDMALTGPTTASLPVFGLRPDTSYSFWATAVSTSGVSVDSAQVSFRTGSLPSYLPVFTAVTAGNPQPGYTMVAWNPSQFREKNAALIVDQTGEIAWYKEFNGYVVIDWQQQPNGTYTAAVDQSVPWVTDMYRQFDKLGNQLKTWSPLDNCQADDHELRMLPNGDVVYFCVNARIMDLTDLGGLPESTVLGNILIRKDSSDQLVFQWDAFDHLSIFDDLDPTIDPTTGHVDWTHGNAIDIASDGNYLLSFRNLSQVMKVDSRTGAVLWKLGGRDGDFTFVDDPLGGFSLQHAIRELPNGNVTLFDDGTVHQPSQSRAVEYQLDVAGRTARLVWQYDATPTIYTFVMGFAQRLSNGNTLVAYGLVPTVREVNAAGDLQWALQSFNNSGFIYRAFRIPSLY